MRSVTPYGNLFIVVVVLLSSHVLVVAVLRSRLLDLRQSLDVFRVSTKKEDTTLIIVQFTGSSCLTLVLR